MKINDTIFTQDAIEILGELKSQLLLNGIDLLGKMRPTGHNVMVCCPYHNGGKERRPSAGIDMTDGTFHCFACGEVHSLPEVISHCFGKEDIGTFGWNWLLKNFLTISIEERKDIPIDVSRNTLYNNTVIEYVSEEELDSYRYIHPYMYKRKLTDEIIEIFDIGYDKQTQCITFPIRDINGNTLFIARRSVNTKFFNYPQGVEKPVYGLYELYQLKEFPKEVYICESMIDALTIWCYGKYAIALNGLGNELSFSQLQKFPCRKFILATDNDEAGKKARVRLRNVLKNKIVTELDCSTYPIGAKDINDMNKEQFQNLKEKFI